MCIEPGMMVRAAPLMPAALALLALYAACAAIASTLLLAHPMLAPALAFDLTVTAAALVWLLAVRPGHARARVLLPVIAIGLAAARHLVGLRALEVAGALAEVVTFGFLALRLRRLVTDVAALRRAGHGLTSALDEALAGVVPFRPLASAIAIEVSALVLAVTGWFRRAPDGFSMHRRTSYLAVIGVLLFLIVVESGAAHLVLSIFSATAAWIATGLSLYTLLWLIGDAHAVRLSPLRSTPEGLVIERGLLWRAFVPWADLADATPIESRVEGALDLSLLGPNVLLTLRTPVVAKGPFGLTRSAARLTLSLDDREAFLARVTLHFA